MMKTIAALFAALAMLLCFTGCGAAPAQQEQPSGETDALTYEELLEMLGMSEQQTGTALTLPVTWTVYNNEELLNFMSAVTYQQPAEYTNTLNEYNAFGVIEEATYAVSFDGASATVTRSVGGEVTKTAQIAQFGMASLANACVDATGALNTSLFAQQMELLDMSLLFEQYPYHMLYGVNAVIALSVEGEYIIFDYYFDESVDEMLAAYGG